MPEAPPLRQALRPHWSVKKGNRNKIVVGGAQQRGKFNKVSCRVESQEKIKNVGRVSTAVRDTGRELHQLL